MMVIDKIGAVSALALTIFALGCNDRGGGRTPTDPALDARSAEASFSRDDGGRGDDGSGSRFKLFGNARMARDPENPSNIVLEVRSVPASTATGAYRELRRVQLWQLDHQLSFHRAFVAPHTCGGGSPRIQLLIDANGDGKFQQAPRGPDFVAHGHVRPPHAGCETSAPTPSRGGPSPSTLLWRFEDLTDEQSRWEITPGGAVPGIPVFPFASWDVLEQTVSTLFPNHQVLRGVFVEDFNPTPGLAYYDLITIFDLTLGTRGQWTPERGDDDGDSDEN
jgi:hypothetical protein